MFAILIILLMPIIGLAYIIAGHYVHHKIGGCSGDIWAILLIIITTVILCNTL